jgi:hypothetical protein
MSAKKEPKKLVVKSTVRGGRLASNRNGRKTSA